MCSLSGFSWIVEKVQKRVLSVMHQKGQNSDFRVWVSRKVKFSFTRKTLHTVWNTKDQLLGRQKVKSKLSEVRFINFAPVETVKDVGLISAQKQLQRMEPGFSSGRIWSKMWHRVRKRNLNLIFPCLNVFEIWAEHQLMLPGKAFDSSSARALVYML